VTRVIADDAEAVAVAAELAARFAKDAVRRDRERILPHAEVAELAERGLLAITVPRGHGGAGVRTDTLAEVVALLAAADGSIGQIPQNHFFFLDLLRHAGTPEQQAFFHGEVLAGARFGNALSEKGGRTAMDFRIGWTTRPGGGARVHGTKYYATGSPFADWIPIYALDEQQRLQAAWIPADHPGVRVVDDWDGVGQRVTGSGTVTFEQVEVPAEHVVPAWTVFESTETFGAFGNYIHAAVDLGIAQGALREGGELIRTLARPWWEAEVDAAAEEPAVIDRFGELALLVRSARALVREAGEAIDAARADLTETSSAEASAAVAAARAQADTAAVTVSSEIFALIGTRAAAAPLGLDRYWRNARTHTLHDPRRWKLRHLGAWELSGTVPPRNGIV
jgi:SfnB family sulfur acquisition oxidoreductase